MRIYRNKSSGEYFICLKEGCFVAPDGKIKRLDVNSFEPDPIIDVGDNFTSMNILTPEQVEKYKMHLKKENSVDVVATCLVQIFGKQAALKHIENIRKKMNLDENEFMDDIERELKNL